MFIRDGMPASRAGGPAVNYESSLGAAGFSLRLSRLAPYWLPPSAGSINFSLGKAKT
jgi:hypothetical protein